MIVKLFLLSRMISFFKNNPNYNFQLHQDHPHDVKDDFKDFNIFGVKDDEKEEKEIFKKINKDKCSILSDDFKKLMRNAITILYSGLIFIALLGWFDVIRSFYDDIWNERRSMIRAIAKFNYNIIITLFVICLIFILYHLNKIFS